MGQALLHMGYQRMHHTVLMTLGICSIFFFIFQPFFPMPQGWFWIAALMAVAALRYVLWLAYGLASRQQTRLGRLWAWLYAGMAVLAGASWSLGAVLLLQTTTSFELLLIVTLTVLAVSAVAVSSLAVQQWAMQGFLLAAILPTVLALMMQGERFAGIAAGVLCAGGVLLSLSGRESGKTIVKLVATRMELSQAMQTVQQALLASEQAAQQVLELNGQLEQRVMERTQELSLKDAALSEALALNQEIFMASAAGMAVYRADGPCIMGNPAFVEIVGGTAESILADDFLKQETWQATGGRKAALRVLATGRKEVLHVETTTSAGLKLWLYCQLMRIEHQGAPHLLVMTQDTTQYKMAEEEIRQLAFFDHLTNLPNRRLLLDRLHQARIAAKRHSCHGALMLLDMDNFKALNDTLGHDVGDRFLVEVAGRLRRCVRSGDTVARQGGDEFMIVLEDINGGMLAASQVESVAVKILQAISQPYQLELNAISGSPQTYSYHCTSSIGIALFQDDTLTVEELMKHADTAMYQDKSAGRNGLRFFDPEMQAEVTAHVTLENELREAVRRNEFVLHYQPQVDHEGRIIGAETLVRWQHPQRGLIGPGEFISLAELNGLILPIGHWVLEQSCQQLQAWSERPECRHLTLAVNVSARQFLRTDYVEQVVAVLERNGIRPDQLKLELTESLLAHDVDDIVAKMTALKVYGVNFSLDDFGTGYSSLAYLKRLPLDQLKIDQSFVRDVLSDPNDATIACTIVALGQSMGLSVIAEGVETQAQREFLASNGCHLYQGYFFSRPVPLAVFEQLLSESPVLPAGR